MAQVQTDQSAIGAGKVPGGSQDIPRLVRNIGRGEDVDGNFKNLFEIFDRRVFYFFVRRGCTREEAHDLTQETFVRLYRGLADYRPEGKFEAWLFSIAANVWRGYVRDQSRLKRDGEVVPIHRVPEWTGIPQPGASESPADPLREVLSKEQKAQLRGAFDALPPQMRQCVLFQVEHGYKYREIALLMKISVDTVRSQLYKAREKLKVRLGEYFTGIEF